ncbi:MAG TPA: DUF4337 domain-containing protein [Opitutaceae bacterium]
MESRLNDNQLSELKSLVAEIRADHQEAKQKEKANAWTKYVSLSMIFLAVLATIATNKGSGYSSATMKQQNEANYFQAQASDQWNYYQAKGIKLNFVEQDLERSQGDVREKLQQKLKRYEDERKTISDTARDFEHKRDLARSAAVHAAESSKAMSLASSIFQITIAIGGICLIVKKRWLWYLAIAGGVAATAQMIYVIKFVA